MQWIVVIGLVLVGGGSVWAGDDIIDIDRIEKRSQAQGQVQGQAQAAVAAQQQSQASDQANEQTSSLISNEESQGQRKDHVQSSPVLYIGGADEGLSVGLPWANASLAKKSEVDRITSCGTFTAANASHTDDRVQRLINQCGTAARRCGLLCHVGRLLF